MPSMLLPLSAAIATPAALLSEVAIPSFSEAHPTAPHAFDDANGRQGTVGLRPPVRDVGESQRTAQAPVPEAVSASENPAPIPREAPSAEAIGRRILSTAFVRVDAHGYMTIERRDGRMIVLRDVVMRRSDYCGVEVVGGTPRRKYCGSYVDVMAARPGGQNEAVEPVDAMSNAIRSPHSTPAPK